MVWGQSPILLEVLLFMDFANIKTSAGQYVSLMGIQELL